MELAHPWCHNLCPKGLVYIYHDFKIRLNRLVEPIESRIDRKSNLIEL